MDVPRDLRVVRWVEVRNTDDSPIDSLLTTMSSIVGFFAALLFVPETKALSLEELDQGTCPPATTRPSQTQTLTDLPFVQFLASRRAPMLLTRSGHLGITPRSTCSEWMWAICRPCTSTKGRLVRRRMLLAASPHNQDRILLAVWTSSAPEQMLLLVLVEYIVRAMYCCH